ncbi:MAG: C-GCAxxG-C-C family protein [Clostridiales bacterium]|nr:C-GCAxxG-C-C family protein [Clostridiales bacterium]
MNKADCAKSFFERGYNCSQSVVLAFCPEMGMAEETAARLAIGFGGGMGRLREICGAVSGMTFVISALYGDRDKGSVYALVQKAAGEFKEKNASIVCRQLLEMSKNPAPENPQPLQRTAAYYKKRPCAMLAYDAALILENLIREEG